jgi:stage II sporulation protein M
MEQVVRLIKRDWPYFLVIAGLFLLGIWLGERLPELSPQAAKLVEKAAMDRFSEIAKLMNGAPLWVEILVIWGNNIAASLTAVLTGILIIPVLPLFFLIGNGMLIGLFQRITATKTGLDLAHFYISLIPHGIFELPAFFIAVGLGIRFGLIPYRLIRDYSKTKTHMPYFREFVREARYYAALIVVLLLIAAIIEVAVSPVLMKQTG